MEEDTDLLSESSEISESTISEMVDSEDEIK